MYEELIDELRLESANMHYEKADCELFAKAADAIAELSQIAAHYEEESKGWWLEARDAKEKIGELQKQVAFEEALAECWEGHAEGCRARFQKLFDAYPRWISVEERLPEEFVSVQAHMTEASPFPSVREAYLAGGKWFFPALNEYHPVDKWAEFLEPPKEET